MTSRKQGDILKRYLPQLVAVVQSNLVSISNACYSKELLQQDTYDVMLESPKTPKEKATLLLSAIKTAVSTQEECLNTFLTILEEEGSCDNLIKEIRTSHRERTPNNPTYRAVSKTVEQPVTEIYQSRAPGMLGQFAESVSNPVDAELLQTHTTLVSPLHTEDTVLGVQDNYLREYLVKLETQSEKLKKDKEKLTDHVMCLHNKLVDKDRQNDILKEEMDTYIYAAYQAKRRAPKTLERLENKIKSQQNRIKKMSEQICELAEEKKSSLEKVTIVMGDAQEVQRLIETTNRALEKLYQSNQQDYEETKAILKKDQKILSFCLLFVILCIAFLFIILLII